MFSLAEELSVSVSLVASMSGCGLMFRIVDLSELLTFAWL